MEAINLILNDSEVKSKPASGVVTLKLPSRRAFAANEPRWHRGCSDCSYDGVSERIVYNHFRYYDPSTGRYITSDRIGLGDGPNTYGYTHQNPLMYFDSLGLAVEGTWDTAPQIRNFSIAITPRGFNTNGGTVNLSATASGSAQFAYAVSCKDTCTGESWNKSLQADLSISITGSVPIPGICSGIAIASRDVGRNGGSLGRKRTHRRIALICDAIFGIKAAQAIRDAKIAVRQHIDERGSALVSHYLNIGPTEICRL